MKTLLLSGLALLAVSSARADFFRSGRDRDRGHRHHPAVRVSIGVPHRVAADYDYSGYAGTYHYCSTLSNYEAYRRTRSYATNGLWLGALTGAIIGHNSGSFHHNGWRGAAWGAGVGLLLGSIAEADRPAVSYVSAQPVTAVAPPQAAAPVAYVQPAPVAAPATPMTAANGLFGR
jgi:hypothetical protein